MQKIYQMYLKLNTKKKKKKNMLKKKKEECLKILTPKQILQSLSIPLRK